MAPIPTLPHPLAPIGRRLALALLGASLLASLSPSPLHAEEEVGSTREDAGLPFGRLGRAVNLARMTAETRNGGLENYRTASCMQRPDGGNCLVEDGDKGFVFRIPGGPPGWQEEGKSPTRESVIRISRDGRQVLRVISESSPRPRPKIRGRKPRSAWWV